MKKLLFVCAYDLPFVKLDYEILQKHFKVQRAGLLKGRKNLFTYILLFFLLGLKVWQNDIVYCWFGDFRARAAVFWSRLLQKKSLVIVGGYELQDYSSAGDFTNRVRPISHLRYCLKKADIVAGLSRYYREKLAEQPHGTKTKIVTLPIAINSKPETDMQMKRDLVLTVCVGKDKQRLYVKGLDIFLQAAALLPQAEFMLIGPDGALLSELKRRIRSENVTLLKRISYSELEKYYAQAKVYCQLSRFESFGSAVAEAMLWKCQPVVADIPALRERVDKFGLVMKKWEAELAAGLITEAFAVSDQLLTEAAVWVEKEFGIKQKEKKLLTFLANGVKDV